MKNFLLYFLFFLLLSLSGYFASPYAREALLNIGIFEEKVMISGTGSMYPTFPKSEGVTDSVAGDQVVAQPAMRRFPGGIKLFGRSFFNYRLQRGDIIEFENEETKNITSKKYGKSAGFVKRVIALPGEKVELRNGLVLINGVQIKEPYVAKPQSTYGGDFLEDCHVVQLPENSIFVLGDNRKASLDSRFELGYVNLNSINYVIPISEQEEFKDRWQKNEKNNEDLKEKSADYTEFVKLLNEKRRVGKSKDLKIDQRLINSASIRGEIILQTDDFSIEATKSGLTLEKAVNMSGYGNILQAEVFTKGFFDSEELLENLFEFPDTKKLLLSNEYQDIGISPQVSEVRNCPTQVTVIHLGGYRAPNYKKEDIESWQKLIENISSILPSWSAIQNAENIDNEKIQKLLSVLNIRLKNARAIYERISINQWLTDDEKKMLEDDISLHNEAEKLINEINDQN